MDAPNLLFSPNLRIKVENAASEDVAHEIQKWLREIVTDERDRQAQATYFAGIDAEWSENLSVTEPPGASTNERYSGANGVDASQVFFGDGDTTVATLVKDRAKTADQWIARDGAVYDHKPTWRDRLRRTKTYVSTKQAMNRLVRGR